MKKIHEDQMSLFDAETPDIDVKKPDSKEALLNRIEALNARERAIKADLERAPEKIEIKTNLQRDPHIGRERKSQLTREINELREFVRGAPSLLYAIDEERKQLQIQLEA